MSKVYTRTGDKGQTGLVDGTRVSKDSLRLETYGTIDELNAVVGICRQHLNCLSKVTSARTDGWLEAIQNDLFNLGSDLATPIASRWPAMILISDSQAKTLEKWMDACELPPLKEFVLPGGNQLNAFLHLARTVCRRAERLAVTLQSKEEINEKAVPFLNRLSDFFFILSRLAIHDENKVPEVTWKKDKGITF